MKILITIITISFAFAAYCQGNFDKSLFQKVDAIDSLVIKIDVEFNTSYPYTFKRINRELDDSKRLDRNSDHSEFADIFVQQDSIFEIYMISRTNDLEIDSGQKCNGHFSQVVLYSYNMIQKEIIDTIVLAQKSIWINPISSGDQIYLVEQESIVYFNKTGSIKEIKKCIKDRTLHSIYNFKNDSIEKKCTIQRNHWNDGHFVLIDNHDEEQP